MEAYPASSLLAVLHDKRQLLKPLVLAVFAFVLSPEALAQPWTITVTTAVDELDNPWTDCPPPGTNDCSLREAITVANWNGVSGDIIEFAAALDGSTIVLSYDGTDPDTDPDPLWIGNEGGTTIDASGVSITIDASNAASAFQIASNGNAIKAGTGSLKIQGAREHGILIYQADNNTIDGVEITGTSDGSPSYGAVTVDGGSDNIIQNCYIHDNDGYGIIVQNNSSNSRIESCEIYRNGLQHGAGYAPSGIVITTGSSNTTMENNYVHENDGHGIIVQNGATDTYIHNNDVEDNGKAHFGVAAGSGILVYGDGTDGTNIDSNDIYYNDGGGIYVLGGDTAGPGNTLIQNNNIYDNSEAGINGVGILIQGVVEDPGGLGYTVRVYNNEIHGNYAQGILLESGSGSPMHVSIENNRIYSNGQEGVLIRDPGTDYNTVTANWIGFYQYSGFYPDPAPNGNSGVAIFNGAQHNDIDNNVICYNRYQNVLVSGSGTDYNTVRHNWILGGTYTRPAVGYDNTGVIVTDGAQNNSIGPGNRIQYHRYDGIQIVGDGTNSNEIIGNNAANDGEISHNSGGIAIMNAYTDAIHNYDLQLGPPISGPAGTVIDRNDVENNHGEGILLRHIAPRSEGVTTISDNRITENGVDGADIGNGIYCIGSSPDITGNTVIGNHENGIKLAVYFSDDDAPSTYDDDVLSDGPSMTISGNTIGGNGLEVIGNSVGVGIYAVDTPLGDIRSLYGANSWSDDDVCHIQQDWYGYVKVVDQDGNGVTGETAVIEANDGSWMLTSSTYDSNGNYGPSGFDIDHELTYFLIPERRILNDGNLIDYTPHYVYIQGTSYRAEYAYNGQYPDPAGEIGGAIESPPGSGWDRYQYAQLTRLSPSPYAGTVVINEILYRQTCGGRCSRRSNDEFIELYFRRDMDISDWIISDGNVISGDTDGTGGFSFTFPAESYFRAGDYVVIWIGEDTGSDLKNAPGAAAQFYVRTNCKLRDKGDDVWLFDGEGKIVDYVAYGSDNSINDQSYLPPGFWDGDIDHNAPSGADKGQSISLTPNGTYSDSKDDWELTTSDTAPGPVTRDTDDTSCDANPRVSSVGVNNNGIDFGDAPSSYGDAGSAMDTSLYMGSAMPDYEDASQYSTDADGDDTDGNDDEDGVSFFPTIRECGDSYSIQVSVTNNSGGNAHLRGWIDFDRNGTFDDDEASDLVTVTDGTSGPVTLTWSSLPADTSGGDTYVRLRLSTESISTSDATGIKGIGEVEDYRITIESCGTDLSIRKTCHDLVPGLDDQLAYTIGVTNDGPSAAHNVTVTDTIPSELSSPEWSYDHASWHPWTGSLNLGTLNAGGTVTVYIRADVGAGVTSVSPNTASVSADEADPDPSDNSSTCTNNVLLAKLEDPKVDELEEDRDGNGVPSPGDILRYTVTIKNVGAGPALEVLFTDMVDPHTALLCEDPYAPSTTKGTITSCGPGPGGSLEVTVGGLDPGESVAIVFYVEIVDYVEEVANQGLVSGSNFPDDPTDDPNTPASDDPTVTRISCYAHDLNGNCVLDLGDVRIVHLMAAGCLPPDMRADFDGDGDVDMDDVTICAQLVLRG